MPTPYRLDAIARGVAALALFAFAFPGSAQAPPCTSVTGGTAEIAVDRDGNARPDCLEIPKKKVDVVWSVVPETDVTQLVVTFDLVNSKKPLDDPKCTGASCTLDKLKAKKAGDFKYTVHVTRADGSTASVDPKLIIKN